MPNGCFHPIPMDLVGTASAIQHIKTKLFHFFFPLGACAFSGSGQGGIGISGGDGQGELPVCKILTRKANMMDLARG